MKYSEAIMGRVFVIRLEDGDIVHQSIEDFAKKESIQSAAAIIIGGADKDSRLVVGPKKGREVPVAPMEHILDNVHEVAGTGTIFLNEKGEPVLHMHMACGRGDNTTTGCVRRGVRVWKVMEVVVFEITHCDAVKVKDNDTGFELLQP